MGAPAIPQVQVGFAVVAENEGRELFEGLQKTGFVFPEHSWQNEKSPSQGDDLCTPGLYKPVLLHKKV